MLPTPDVLPTPPAALGAHWEAATGLDGGTVYDLAHGPQGWVAVGSTCADDCYHASAAAWFSADGHSWSGGTLPGEDPADDARPYTDVSTVATDGRTWFAAGTRFVNDGKSTAALARALFWRSTDGRTWSRAGSMRLGYCYEGCPSIGQLAAGPGGLVLSMAVVTFDSERTTAWWSPDATSWTPIDASTFGTPGSIFGAVASVANDRFIIASPGCRKCGRVWSSADGRSWTLDGTLTRTSGSIDIASDGRRVVVAQDVCLDDEPCHPAVWHSADGRSGWTQSWFPEPVARPRLTFAAGMFVLASGAGTWMRVFTSADGATWTKLETDLDLGDCDDAALAGDADQLLIAGDGDCPSLWVSDAPPA